MQFENSRSFAISMDEADELASFRDRFLQPAHGNGQAIYLLGNSLGLQPRQTQVYINEILKSWQDFGVEGFFMGKEPWLEYHEKLAAPLAAMVGAEPDEIVVMNQLTVNLHLMMASFYKPQGKRRKIICEAKAFPSDQYLLESQCRFHGLDPDDTIVEVKPRAGTDLIAEEDIENAIRQCGDELALVLWGGVNYYTGQYFDLKRLAVATHAAGALLGLDLAHAVGNLPLQLDKWDPDFACWCNYKYVNAGPGSIAAAFIPRRYHKSGRVRLAGWWGYDKAARFKMEKGFVPVQSAEGWQLSTPSPILYAALRASLEIFEEAGMQKLREKSLQLTGYLYFLLDELKMHPAGARVKILTPADPEKRGCQVSLLFEQQGRAIFDALMKEGIFVDWREPNVIRLAPVPLYNQFEEVWKFCDLLKRIG